MSSLFRIASALVFSLCALVAFHGCASSASHLLRAEALRKEQQYELAIEEYELYVAQRKTVKDLPPEQNPFFYYLLIGDCRLALGQVEEAKVAYLTARDNGVEKDLVGAKLRNLAHWHEERREYDAAIAILQEFRALDPLLFDVDLDRNHKKLLNAYPEGPE